MGCPGRPYSMKLVNFLGSANSISGRNKALWIVGTKIFTETETYSTFSISPSSASMCTSNRGRSAYGIGGDFGGPSRNAWKFFVVGEYEISLGSTAVITARAYNQGGGDNFAIAGYVAGGLTTSYGHTGTSEKVSYSTDVFSSLSAITSRGYLATFSNSGAAAYHAGGFGGATGQSYVTRVDKRFFSNDSLSTVTVMATGRQYPYTISNHGTAGYIMGGQNTSSTRTNSIEKYIYSNDSRSTLSAILSNSPYAAQGGALIGVRGYSLGGSNAANTVPTKRTDRINFSNDTISTLSDTLSDQWYGGIYENG